ncbi:Z1 domain-containing protein [Mesoplasma florum]|uniref:Z1 domain-containing protein n=1 Tax=Mesoplasma florum TaxID=2151 RepID=UPI000D02D4B3|nr:Z1 domain-containing protein [Mesoplasma florum]AVN58942.1 hypothetical protein CG009_01725 [Mesoplasma florum]
MSKIKIYKKIGNKNRRDLPFQGFYKIFNLFLKYQSENIFKYDNLKITLNDNINKIFKEEIDNKNLKKYSGVLAYGDVQSGKTANMMCSIIWAYENGFKNIFILTGNTTPLHNQTRERFCKEINDFNVFLEKSSQMFVEGIINEIEFQEISEYKIKRAEIKPNISMYDFLDILNKKEQERNNFQIKLQRESDDENLNVFFVLKNVAHYQMMLKIVESFGVMKERNGILIVDDEADWGFESENQNEAPQLFNKLVEIKKICEKRDYYLKYLAFTATPYKILENINNELLSTEKIVLLNSKKIEEWMSEEYILNHQPFYSGIDFFHNNNKNIRFSDKGLNDIFSKEYFTIVKNKSEEIELLALSLLIFLSNTHNYNKEYATNGKKMKIVYGLYFPDVIQSVHEATYENLLKIIKIIKNNLNEISENKTDNLVELILKGFSNQQFELREILNQRIIKRGFLSFKEFILKWIKQIDINPDNFLVKMSGLELDHNKYDKKQVIDGVNAVFIIGGYKIARGVTFSPLLLETIIKKSDKADSTLQRARWFGYRDFNELSNMDIILSEETFKSFKDAANEDISWRESINKLKMNN